MRKLVTTRVACTQAAQSSIALERRAAHMGALRAGGGRRASVAHQHRHAARTLRPVARDAVFGRRGARVYGGRGPAALSRRDARPRHALQLRARLPARASEQ